MSAHLGPRLRVLRRERGVTQAALATTLGISASYLNLIESGKRPLPAEVLLAAARALDMDLRALGSEGNARVVRDLLEALADPVLEDLAIPVAEARELAHREPQFATALVKLHQALRNSRELEGALASQVYQREGESASRIPPEEVTDLVETHHNYFPALEEAAEQLGRDARLDAQDLYPGLVAWLKAHGVEIQIGAPPAPGIHARYDPDRRQLAISEWLPTRSRNFEMARTCGRLVAHQAIATLAEDRILTTPTSRALARSALGSYFAAAVLMPYAAFLDAAETLRYDVELVGRRFRVGFEQACHRMTTLSRPKHEGVPFHLVRIDVAGNISKRFAGSGIHFARFSGVCPRWNVFSAFAMPGRIRTQLSRMPDGSTFFCIARTVQEDSRGWGQEGRLHAVGLGTDVAHAKRIVYADGISLTDAHNVVPIGVTCRLCERPDCAQRALPSIRVPLLVDENQRRSSPYGT